MGNVYGWFAGLSGLFSVSCLSAAAFAPYCVSWLKPAWVPFAFLGGVPLTILVAKVAYERNLEESRGQFEGCPLWGKVVAGSSLAVSALGYAFLAITTPGFNRNWGPEPAQFRAPLLLINVSYCYLFAILLARAHVGSGHRPRSDPPP